MQQLLNQADQKGGHHSPPPPIFPKKKRRCLYRLFREKVDKEVSLPRWVLTRVESNQTLTQACCFPSISIYGRGSTDVLSRINARGRQMVMKLWQMKMLLGRSRVLLPNEARDTSVQATL